MLLSPSDKNDNVLSVRYKCLSTEKAFSYFAGLCSHLPLAQLPIQSRKQKDTKIGSKTFTFGLKTNGKWRHRHFPRWMPVGEFD